MRQKKGTLYCFSPTVMLATFLFEIGAALYIAWRYKWSSSTRLVIAILTCLAVFQAAEYIICGGGGMKWAQIGFVAITLLPPLGFHLAHTLAGKTMSYVVYAAYATSAVFIVLFGFMSHSLTSQTCTGNYVIFEFAPGVTPFYSVYYYGWLLLGTIVSYRWAKSAKDKARSKALQALMAGYLLFMLPTTLANLVDPMTIRAIPSVMCGFAVLLAVVLVYWVVPAIGKVRNAKAIVRYNR